MCDREPTFFNRPADDVTEYWRPDHDFRTRESVSEPNIDRSCLPDMPLLVEKIWDYRFSIRSPSLDEVPEVNIKQRLDVSQVPPIFKWGDFLAISYCWESVERDKEVMVGKTVIRVTTNLEAMLRQMQTLPEAQNGTLFWADGLCINQENELEKNHQVHLMRRIYKDAKQVIVWLGRANGKSDHAMDTIAHIADVEERLQAMDTMTPFADASMMRWRAQIDWLSVLSLLSRNYWRRLWIIQELALNRKKALFMCGDRRLTRQAIWQVCLVCMRYADDIEQQLSTACHSSENPVDVSVSSVWHTAYDILTLFKLDASRDLDLDDLLDLARKANVKDARDKVYGLLGILPHRIASHVCPDYSVKSKQDVYHEFANILLAETGLDGLLAWCSYDVEEKVPSWVPSWDKPFKRYQLKWLRESSAGGHAHNTAQQRFIDARNELHCTGILCGSIDSLGQAPANSLPYGAVQTCPRPRLRVSSHGQYQDFTQLACALDRTLQQNQCHRRGIYELLVNIPWVHWPERRVSVLSIGPPNVPEEINDDGTSERWKDFDRFRQTNA